MKKNTFNLSALFILCCIITLAGCSKIKEYQESKKRVEQEKQKELQRADKEAEKYFQELDYRKEATLLSLKYKTDEGKVFNFLAEFKDFEAGYKDFGTEDIQASVEGKSFVKSKLNLLAEKYNIPVEILANILIDYYSMQK